jgi:hypothetical protein
MQSMHYIGLDIHKKKLRNRNELVPALLGISYCVKEGRRRVRKVSTNYGREAQGDGRGFSLLIQTYHGLC